MEDIITRLKEGVKDTGVLISSAAEVNTVMHIAATEILSLREQLVATQAHAARLASAVQPIIELADAYDEQFGDEDKTPMTTAVGPISPDVLRDIRKVAYRPINLDALHEDRARECERLAAGLLNENAIEWLQKEAAAHRAKKGQEK